MSKVISYNLNRQCDSEFIVIKKTFYPFLPRLDLCSKHRTGMTAKFFNLKKTRLKKKKRHEGDYVGAAKLCGTYIITRKIYSVSC